MTASTPNTTLEPTRMDALGLPRVWRECAGVLVFLGRVAQLLSVRRRGMLLVKLCPPQPLPAGRGRTKGPHTPGVARRYAVSALYPALLSYHPSGISVCAFAWSSGRYDHVA